MEPADMVPDELESKLPEPTVSPLAAAMSAVQATLDKRLPKTGYNSFHDYHYTTESDVADTLRVALGLHGVTILPAITRFERNEMQSSTGKPTALWTVELNFRIQHESGEYLNVPWVGVATDNDDKGLSKAVTSGTKYFLIKTFMLSADEEDPDSTATDLVGTDAPSAKPRPIQAPPPQRSFGGGGQSRGVGPITEGQVRLVFGRGQGAGLSGDQVVQFVKDALGVEFIEEIQRVDLDGLLEKMDEYGRSGEWPGAVAKAQDAEAEEQSELVRAAVTNYQSLKSISLNNGGTDDDLAEVMKAHGFTRQLDLVVPSNPSSTEIYDQVKAALLLRLGVVANEA